MLQAKADIAFFFGQGSWPGATCIELFREAVVPVCAPGFVAERSDAFGAHFIAHAEHAGEIPKVNAFLNWMVEYTRAHPDF